MTIEGEKITALILAGGLGTRMRNQDKGWVHYRNQPLIHHAINIVKPQVGQIALSFNRNPERYLALSYPASVDIKPDYQGPLAGLLSCRKIIETPYTFVMPCDMPNLPSDVVSRLADQIGRKDIAVAHDGHRLQSLIFIVRSEVIDSIDNYFSTGKRSARGWIESLNGVVVDFADAGSDFLNINKEPGSGNQSP